MHSDDYFFYQINNPKPSDSLFAVEMNEKRAAKQEQKNVKIL